MTTILHSLFISHISRSHEANFCKLSVTVNTIIGGSLALLIKKQLLCNPRRYLLPVDM